jgi:hypothetical protein
MLVCYISAGPASKMILGVRFHGTLDHVIQPKVSGSRLQSLLIQTTRTQQRTPHPTVHQLLRRCLIMRLRELGSCKRAYKAISYKEPSLPLEMLRLLAVMSYYYYGHYNYHKNRSHIRQGHNCRVNVSDPNRIMKQIQFSLSFSVRLPKNKSFLPVRSLVLPSTVTAPTSETLTVQLHTGLWGAVLRPYKLSFLLGAIIRLGADATNPERNVSLTSKPRGWEIQLHFVQYNSESSLGYHCSRNGTQTKMLLHQLQRPLNKPLAHALLTRFISELHILIQTKRYLKMDTSVTPLG